MHHVGAGINPDLAPTIPISLFFLFQLAFAIITPTIIIGAVADRCAMDPFLGVPERPGRRAAGAGGAPGAAPSRPGCCAAGRPRGSWRRLAPGSVAGPA